jgi:hypothetical protein
MLNKRIKKILIEQFKDFLNMKFTNIYYEVKSYSSNDIEVHLYDKNYFEDTFILDLINDKIIIFKRENKNFFISTENFEIFAIIE